MLSHKLDIRVISLTPKAQRNQTERGEDKKGSKSQRRWKSSVKLFWRHYTLGFMVVVATCTWPAQEQTCQNPNIDGRWAHEFPFLAEVLLEIHDCYGEQNAIYLRDVRPNRILRIQIWPYVHVHAGGIFSIGEQNFSKECLKMRMVNSI